MATGKIVRTDDGSGPNIATVTGTEDAVSKHWQGCVIVDNTDPVNNKLAVSAAGALSLPTGASTAAKQPALGTAGTASTDVITVQGIASMTKLLVTPDANSAINLAQVGGNTVVTGGTNGSQGVGGLAAHGASVAGNPMLNGYDTIAHGANPTAVTAGQMSYGYANRHGIPFVCGPHMNVITIEYTQADADGAQTNLALVTVSAGTKIAVTQVQVSMDEANTVGVAVRLGFAAATLSAASTTPVAGILFGHSGMLPGTSMTRGDGLAILGIGADGEDLRITTEDAVGGALKVVISYFTIES